MIKFFQKIHQKMLSENKLSEYLLYAFGEIVLVAIGISNYNLPSSEGTEGWVRP